MAKGKTPPVLNADGTLTDETKQALREILETNPKALQIYTDGIGEMLDKPANGKSRLAQPRPGFVG
jgi:hypothetical protein